MAVSQSSLDRLLAQATARKNQGYFARVAQGDQRAASLFVRMVAYDVNPSGQPDSFGWLTKAPGESQVDGWAEDAVCGNADAADLHNVVDLVNGTGAPGASLPSRLIVDDLKERRAHNVWKAPKPLSDDELDYLLSGGEPVPVPEPEPEPVYIPGYEELGGDQWHRDNIGKPLEADMHAAGQALNEGSSVWFSRTIYDCIVACIEAGHVVDRTPIVTKHRNEWRAILGLPPI